MKRSPGTKMELETLDTGLCFSTHQSQKENLSITIITVLEPMCVTHPQKEN